MLLIDLELDDWLDPSLPRMYSEEELREGVIEPVFSDEFTHLNWEHSITTVLPPYPPPKIQKSKVILIRPSDSSTAVESQASPIMFQEA